jgi:SAM-dependent methyltransferase
MADQPSAGKPDHEASFAVNLANWEEAAPVHAASADYGFALFAEDPAHLSEVVRFDLPRLGDVRGLDGVHLQSHIGTDTVSLARLGARMTGLDFSAAAVAEATRLAASASADATFVQGNVYDAVELLGRERFDLVFTGIGALCWLPDIRRWAGVVDGLLRPGGRLFLREGHPVLWSLDYERKDGLVVLDTSYFEHAEPIVDVDDGTYVETDHVFANTVTHSWYRGLGEIVTALLDRGFVLTGLEEHDSVPWEALPGTMVRDEHGEWRLQDRPRRLPCTYTLQARKPGS